jgi:hypothetical protein
MVITVQYGLGEKYLIDRLHKYRAGYLVVAFGMLLSIVYGVYVMQFVEFMEALGIMHLITASTLFYKFYGRYSKIEQQSGTDHG